MPGSRSRTKNAAGLMEIEERFVREYLVDLSQANAMKRADGGGKKKAWKELGYQMMQKPHVRSAVDRALKEQYRRLDVDADDVKLEIIRMALFDPAHLTAVQGPQDIAQLPPDVRRAIVGWSWDRFGNFVVKLAKEGSLEMLAKHFGLYEADNRQKGTLTLKKSAADMSDEELAAIAQHRKDEPEPATGS